jgi:oligopeptide/dipeptide ABC transporter ATP-binding protein
MVPSLFNLPKGCSFAPRCAFASEQCRTAVPTLAQHRSNHWVACWHAGELQ